MAFNPAGKTNTEIVKALKMGLLSKDAALEHLLSSIENVAHDEDGASIRIKKLESVAADIRSCTVLVNTSSSVEGALLYILFKVSPVVCTPRHGVTSFDLCGDCEPSSSSSGSTSNFSHQKSYSASLVRPKNVAQAASLFNFFVMICTAAGLSMRSALLKQR